MRRPRLRGEGRPCPSHPSHLHRICGASSKPLHCPPACPRPWPPALARCWCRVLGGGTGAWHRPVGTQGRAGHWKFPLLSFSELPSRLLVAQRAGNAASQRRTFAHRARPGGRALMPRITLQSQHIPTWEGNQKGTFPKCHEAEMAPGGALSLEMIRSDSC